MALKQYKPTSPARRGLILVDKSSLWKGKPVKALTGAVFAQWSYAGVGTLVDMNARIAADRGFARYSRYGPDFFDVPAPVLVLILCAFVAVFLCAAALLLRQPRGVDQ